MIYDVTVHYHTRPLLCDGDDWNLLYSHSHAMPRPDPKSKLTGIVEVVWFTDQMPPYECTKGQETDCKYLYYMNLLFL